VGELEVKFSCWVSRAIKVTRRVNAPMCDADTEMCVAEGHVDLSRR
jgi:hypothetical protein